MTEAIVVALITGGCALMGQWMITRSERNKSAKKQTEEAAKKAAEQAVEKTKLESMLQSMLEKLDEHNNYAQKFVEQGERLENIEKQIIAMAKDIEYLKKGA